MKVLTVVGARPQFVKAAMVSRELVAREDVEEVLVHTGQHFDRNMSGVFFEELGMRSPKVNLGISGGSHGQMTGRMMMALEDVFVAEKPDTVLLYGDTNSTLAGALAAAKLDVPICHAEAGARTGFKSNPEEVNRICADHLASSDCAPTPSCLDNLVKEGLGAVSFFTGDLMYDAFLRYAPHNSNSDLELKRLDGGIWTVPRRYCYLTCHRQENATKANLFEILLAMSELDIAVAYPVHPRMRKLAEGIATRVNAGNLILIEPVGYLESVRLTSGAEFVITDSGGLQREAFFAQKKCVTLLPFPSAEELLSGGRNTIVDKIEKSEILSAIGEPQTIDEAFRPFGDGTAAAQIADQLFELDKEASI